MPTAIIDPDDVTARHLAGLHQLAAGDTEAALRTFRHVLCLDPCHPGARRNLIRALAAGGDHAAVITATTDALRDAPDSAELHFLRGSARNALSDPMAAIAALTASLVLDPSFAPAWLSLGNACMDLDDPPAAEAHCRCALALDPALGEAHASLGHILTAQGKVRDGITALEAAVHLDPGNVQAHWNLAAALLLTGDLPRGFAEYEWCKRHHRYRGDFIDPPGPRWDGDHPRGRTILVRAEQGLGDTVQFARYLPLIARGGGTPVLACPTPLAPLLSSLPGVQVVARDDPAPPHDAWIDHMSLPLAFRTTLATIPSPAGYLRARPELIVAHRLALPPGRTIGLAWAGNPAHGNNRRRTPPEAAFRPLLALPNCHFVSLVPGRALPGTSRPGRPLTDYAETAALIAALDLVITIDTSVAHVAGALGCRAWVLLPYAPDWRWLLSRPQTPWYKSLRLFRQPSPGDWRSVIARVIAQLIETRWSRRLPAEGKSG